MYKEVHRGDIWIVDWSPGRGSEQAGMRPALIIQTDAANRNPHYPNTIVLTISTKGKAVPFHVSMNPSEENGLKETSFVKCEQILTISKERLIRCVGRLENERLETVAESDEGRGKDLIACMKGKATAALRTDAILAMTRE